MNYVDSLKLSWEFINHLRGWDFKTKNVVFHGYYSSYLLDLAPSDWFFSKIKSTLTKYRKFEL